MNNEEIKRTVKLFLNEYHNSLFTNQLTEGQLDKIFNRLSDSIIEKVKKGMEL